MYTQNVFWKDLLTCFFLIYPSVNLFMNQLNWPSFFFCCSKGKRRDTDNSDVTTLSSVMFGDRYGPATKNNRVHAKLSTHFKRVFNAYVNPPPWITTSDANIGAKKSGMPFAACIRIKMTFPRFEWSNHMKCRRNLQ